MRSSLLPILCVLGILAGSAAGQTYDPYPKSSVKIVDTGGGYRLVVAPPTYTPASSIPSYYRPGYSPVMGRNYLQQTETPANFYLRRDYYYNLPDSYYYFRARPRIVAFPGP